MSICKDISGLVMAGMLCLAAGAVQAFGNDHEGHDMGSMDHPGQSDGQEDHSRHMSMMRKQADYKRSVVQYRYPTVTLLDETGKRQTLDQLLTGDQPVVLNFIFTTCTTICPVMTATFAQFDQLLSDEERAKVRMISISIDPEQDRPKQLARYREKFSAGDNWTFLTGSLEDIIKVLKSFDVYRGNKMNHEPVTLIRNAGASQWVRLDGLTSARDLVQEYRHLLSEDKGRQEHDRHANHSEF